MRLSQRGIGVLTAGVAMLVAGFGFGYPELAALGCAALVATAGALVFVAWRPTLELVREIDPDRVMRGESSRVTLAITNTSRFFAASLIARDRLRPRSVQPGDAVAPVPLLRLRPGRVTLVSYQVPTTRRGLVDLGPLEVSRRDPLALAAVVRQYGEAGEVWVRPRVHPILAIPVGRSRSMDGLVDKVPQGTITFSTLRHYVVGDDLRRIHWRTSARIGELMVREHVDTSLPRLVILLDDRAYGHTLDQRTLESTFEAACEAAASIVVAAARDGIHIELQTVTGERAAGGQDELAVLLDLLTEVVPRVDPDFAGETAEGEISSSLRLAVERLRVRRMGDTLVYLTGPPDEQDLGIVASLRGAYPSIIAGVFGPVESGLATTAGILVVGATDGADFAGAWDGIRAW